MLMQAQVTGPPDPTLFPSTDGLRRFISPANVAPGAPKPVPTNNWWGNLLSNNGNQEVDPVYPSPYAVFITKRMGTLACSYLHQYVQHGPLNANGAIAYYFTPRVENLQFSAAFPSQPKFAVEHWDDFGVLVAFSSGDASVRSYLCQGQAFTTLSYTNVIIVLKSQHAFLTIDGRAATEGMRVGDPRDAANSVVLTLNNGQTWFVAWTSTSAASVALEFDGQSFRSVGPFTGVVQAAYVAGAEALALLRDAAGTFVSGMGIEVHSARALSYHFSLSHAQTPARRPFHFALTHHEALLDQAAAPALSLRLFAHSRGPMTAHVLPAARWDLAFPEAEDAKLARYTGLVLPESPSPADVAAYGLMQVLADEVHGAWTLPASYYFQGKALQKYGSMCVVAAELAKTLPEAAALATTALAKLKTLLTNVGQNAGAYPLVYDTVYGGIISREGLDKHDVNVEFGNAVYNDHHYHYGYFITAVAIAYTLDPAWIDSASALHRFVETLLRDTLTPSADAYFPRCRHFDWFLGHSYSHGVTPMVDGKDEESTSEEMNLFYGAHLFAAATGNAPLQALSALLLKLVARAHQTYFLIADDNLTHPEGFRKNKVAGILFDNKSDYATWFSPARECIHGIQMLPVTPALHYARPLGFVAEEWRQILSTLVLDDGNAWRSLLAVNHSRLEPRRAADVLRTCAMDDGLSRAFALFMALSHCESPFEDDGWVYLPRT
ncbi:endo-1,3(4)-beta-glucanase [Achlya hypogyna]|uniref:glucan endo-1,3-beta-D-glucosidase n=1 Tax=Achlya hypogyna TaxID=1202772 RepID=A0A1V9YPA1_ACHHY|nr:endo-1,3(4)-beta-glucanase [Achlya hypogyna]